MTSIPIDPHQSLHYEDEYFGEPWVTPETVLLIHGAAESSKAWFAWVPHLARSYRWCAPICAASANRRWGPGRSSGHLDLSPPTWPGSWMCWISSRPT